MRAALEEAAARKLPLIVANPVRQSPPPEVPACGHPADQDTNPTQNKVIQLVTKQESFARLSELIFNREPRHRQDPPVHPPKIPQSELPITPTGE